jgi:hypothetical protein
MQTILIFTLAFRLLAVQTAPAGSAQPPPGDTAAFVRIANERNAEIKKKLALDFEKKFPRSKHLPDVYVQLSRVLVSQTDFTTAKQYADKAVNTVIKLENNPPEGADNAWREWIKTVKSSAASNVAWINQMMAWQQEQVRANAVGRRKP